MSPQQRERLAVEGYPSQEPEIGRSLWCMQDARRRTLRALEGIALDAVAWEPPDGGSTIGTVLYHIADIEADWLFVEVLEQELPPEVAALFPHATREADGGLTQVPGFTLDEHLQRLEHVRALLLDVYRGMSLADFRRPRSLEPYDVTPEWVLYHLMQHEAEHRSQIGSLRAGAERHRPGQ